MNGTTSGYKNREPKHPYRVAPWQTKVALWVRGAVFQAQNPRDPVSGLGVGSVAIGFAFKDILQNWLAGMLILLRQPFDVGDDIIVGGHEGTVERIENRAPLIRTYAGQRVITPNADLYTDIVQVITANDARRPQMDFGIGYKDNIDAACQIMLDVVSGIDGLAVDPRPQALLWSLDASWVTLRLRWWVKADGPVLGTCAAVLKNVKAALEKRRHCPALSNPNPDFS